MLFIFHEGSNDHRCSHCHLIKLFYSKQNMSFFSVSFSKHPLELSSLVFASRLLASKLQCFHCGIHLTQRRYVEKCTDWIEEMKFETSACLVTSMFLQKKSIRRHRLEEVKLLLMSTLWTDTGNRACKSSRATRHWTFLFCCFIRFFSLIFSSAFIPDCTYQGWVLQTNNYQKNNSCNCLFW